MSTELRAVPDTAGGLPEVELHRLARLEIAEAYERAVAILAADPYHPALPDYRQRLRAARLAAGLPMAREVR